MEAKPPISVRIIGWVYVLAGAGGFANHFSALRRHPFDNDALWVEFVSLIAVVAGVYLLRGHNWARWLALAWMGFHVVLSFFHTLLEFAMHALFFAILAYLLFRRRLETAMNAARRLS